MQPLPGAGEGTRSESGSPTGFPRDGAADDKTDSYDDPSTAGKGSHTPRGYFLALDDGFDGQAQAGDPSVPSWHSLAAQAEAELSVYEMKLAQAFELDISPWDEEPRYHWNFVQSVFFASTVITSIGYGNIAPKTTEGRVFCIIFALIGIPLTLTALTDLGRMLATSAASLYKRIRARFAWVRRVTIGHGTEAGTSIATKSLYVLAGLSMLTLYIAFGGMLFMLLERWSFFESFYFCFITMTTIGLGDLVPGNTTYTLFCTLYIFLGLALTSTTIELVRRQYAESWERMKMLSGRLAELSGPLSDTLKRLGEQAHRRGGDMTNVDMSLLKELRELRKAVAITKMEMETGCALSDQSFSDNFDFDPPPPPPPRPKVVWIIYETNV
ncbi:unnamed protein product [Notodromas monacha]|uniref:Potassium channel domain-containing protein n=1 Tax=Notodromas monacha TaxID=399045 RepID=A0A7R9GDC4_9CRUS|nr:unnamed protein product [Notodromas monacha]CAG0916815.1 unnamed protein product [Notodromas monacha]